ncbi:unnamed protein product [Peniophora sp. CBMAI 1063]|nr:unnamed protein product [Peniophora sp. CBMAI 1063]
MSFLTPAFANPLGRRSGFILNGRASPPDLTRNSPRSLADSIKQHGGSITPYKITHAVSVFALFVTHLASSIELSRPNSSERGRVYRSKWSTWFGASPTATSSFYLRALVLLCDFAVCAFRDLQPLTTSLTDAQT